MIDKLLASDEPSIVWKIRVNVLGENPKSDRITALQNKIRNSARVKTLLSHRDRSGKIINRSDVYDKWQGSHWILASLADIGYPEGDGTLASTVREISDFWLRDVFYQEFKCDTKQKAYAGIGVRLMNGRYRRCASQQGNAMFIMLRLGFDFDSIPALAERLLHWQWPDGGWNCDKNPDADTSSFMETLIPLRALSLYFKKTKDRQAGKAVSRAAEVFLRRKLFRRISDDTVINREFTFLHYPLYWHYDILGGLKVMAEAGFIGDRRCAEAVDLLESKMLRDGGFPAEKKYYNAGSIRKHGNDYVDWGGTGKGKANEWVTADALYVLKEAGRLKV